MTEMSNNVVQTNPSSLNPAPSIRIDSDGEVLEVRVDMEDPKPVEIWVDDGTAEGGSFIGLGPTDARRLATFLWRFANLAEGITPR